MANLTVNTFAVNPETEKALRKHIILKLKLTPEGPRPRERVLGLNQNKLIRAAPPDTPACDTSNLANDAPSPSVFRSILIQRPNVERLKGEKGCEER